MTIPANIPPEIYQWAADHWDAHLETEQVEMVALAFMAGQQAGPKPTASRFGLTAPQLSALSFIEAQCANERDPAPSLREMARGLGISLSHAQALVTALVDRGFVTRIPGRARSIALIHVHSVSAAHINSGVA